MIADARLEKNKGEMDKWERTNNQSVRKKADMASKVRKIDEFE